QLSVRRGPFNKLSRRLPVAEETARRQRLIFRLILHVLAARDSKKDQSYRHGEKERRRRGDKATGRRGDGATERRHYLSVTLSLPPSPRRPVALSPRRLVS